MHWSKLKQVTEGRFADDVRGRVQLWTTRYRQPWHRVRGPDSRSWITVDGRTVVNMHDHQSVDGVFSDGHPDRFRVSLFGGCDLPSAARAFLSLSIDDAFASSNTLVRALAVLDRRTGRRRLAAMDPVAEVPLVATLLTLRTERKTATAE